ncbi:MAG TPA: type VII secretion protein EccB [Micromonosporaceae bacterium]
MQTRREQVRAQRFITRRIVSALLLGEPESLDLPMRRLALALLASAMLASVAFAAVGVYGLLNPSGGRPDEQTLIIERETGARYVYLDNVLYPVLNYTSARLILGTPDPAVRTMSQNSLRDLPRGLPVGIEGAPDALPAPKALLGLPWTVCSTPESTNHGKPVTELLVGQGVGAGSALGDDAVLVISEGIHYLIWHDHRLRVRDRTMMAALNLTTSQALPIGVSLLNAIPAGPDLAPISLPDGGHDTTLQIHGAYAKIGQLYHVGQQHYLATTEGLVPVGEVTATLLRANGALDTGITAREAGSYLIDARVEPDGLPTSVPSLREVDVDDTEACATYAGGGNGDRVTVRLVRAPAQPPVGAQHGDDQVVNGVRLVNRVSVAGGRGALVQMIPAFGATTTGSLLYLITDQGIRYPIPSGDVTVALGYQGVKPTPVPAALVSLIPLGPALDPAAAKSFSGRVTTSPSPSPQPPPANPKPTPSTARPSSPAPRSSSTSSRPPTRTSSPKPSATSPKPSTRA